MLKLTCSICHTNPSIDLTNPHVNGHVGNQPVCSSCVVKLALLSLVAK